MADFFKFLGEKSAEIDQDPAVPARIIRQFAPLTERRELQPRESAEIDQGRGQLIPSLVQTDSTQIPEMMSSPGKGALLHGALGAAAGGLLGHSLDNRFGHGAHGTAATALGAVALGIPAALHSYLARHHENDHLEEAMRRLPPGATKRDYDVQELLGQAIARRFKTGSASTKHITVRPHRRRYPARNKKAMTPAEIKAESCPHCGARQERGDDGSCNQCNKPWPMTKAAMTPFAAGFLSNCFRAGLTSAQIKIAIDKLAPELNEFTVAELEDGLVKAGVGPALGELGEDAMNLGKEVEPGAMNFFKKLAPNAASAIGRGARNLFGDADAGASVAAKAPVAAKAVYGPMMSRLSTGAGAAGAAYMDPHLMPHTPGPAGQYTTGDMGHDMYRPTLGRVGATLGAGLFGAAMPGITSRILPGYGAGEAVDNSAMMMGAPDLNTRYLGGAASLAGSLSGNPGPMTRALTHEPYSFAPWKTDPSLPTGARIAQGVRQGLTMPINAVPSAINQFGAKNLLNVAGAGGGIAATLAVAQGAQIPGQVADVVNKGLAAGKDLAANTTQQVGNQAINAVGNAEGLNPADTQQLKDNSNRIDMLNSGNPAATSPDYWKGKPVFGADGQVDKTLATKFLSDQNNQIHIKHFGEMAASPTGMKMIGQVVENGMGVGVDKLKSLIGSGGSQGAGAMAGLMKFGDTLLGLFFDPKTVSGMSPIAKIMILLGGMGILGGGAMGSGGGMGLGGLALLGGLAQGGVFGQHGAPTPAPAPASSASPSQSAVLGPPAPVTEPAAPTMY